MSSFSKLFKLFLAVVFMPLVPMVLLLSYYQVHLKDNILETHVNLAEIVAASFSQHIEDLSWRLSFSQNLSHLLSQKKNPSALLQEALSANPDFLMLAVISKDGKELYRQGASSFLKRIPPIDLSGDASLPALAQEHKLYVSSFDVMDGRPISEFIYPMPNGDFLYGIISFFGFLARVQEQRIGNTGHIYIMAQDGSVYASEYQYVPAFDRHELTDLFASDKRLIKNLKSPQETYVGAFAPTPVLGAYVTVLQLKKEAFRSIYHTNIILILFLLTIATFSYFGALTFAEQLGEPITALTGAAEEVSRGNFDVRVDEKTGWKEFRQLITSFNKMTKDLKDYQALQVQAELSQMKEKVFRAIAHDLRAPLLGLQGYLYILQNGKVSAKERKEYLAQMDSASKNLSLLLEDALDVSRLEAGMMVPHKTTVDIPALVKRVMDTLAPVAAEKKLSFTSDVSVEHLPADEKFLQRVLTNLVSNALKFTKEGFVKVTASQDEQAYFLSVADSGIGISEKDIKGLFQKFHQVRPEAQGYGLGLFISRQIIEAHGGTLTVRSEEGKGSTFTVRLPKEKV